MPGRRTFQLQDAYAFPINTQNIVRPLVSFSAYDPDGAVGSATFMLPSDFRVGDSASFNSFDMSVNVSAAVDTALASGQGMTAGNIAGMARDVAVKTRESTIAGVILAEMAKNGRGFKGDAAKAALQKTGVATNPNTTVAFNNMNIRTFSFSFTMFPTTRRDSKMIQDITHFFREKAYAAVNETGHLLTYPCVFEIDFSMSNDPNNRLLSQYPKIAECYLTNMSVSYNSESGLNFEDGSAQGTTVSLEFQETRVLNADDIEALRTGRYKRAEQFSLRDLDGRTAGIASDVQRRVEDQRTVRRIS